MPQGQRRQSKRQQKDKDFTRLVRAARKEQEQRFGHKWSDNSSTVTDVELDLAFSTIANTDFAPGYEMRVALNASGRCWFCGHRMGMSPSNPFFRTWDHIVPRSKGGTDDAWNLVRACRTCNVNKASKSLEEFRFFVGIREFWGENRTLDAEGRLIRRPSFPRGFFTRTDRKRGKAFIIERRDRRSHTDGLEPLRRSGMLPRELPMVEVEEDENWRENEPWRAIGWEGYNNKWNRFLNFAWIHSGGDWSSDKQAAMGARLDVIESYRKDLRRSDNWLWRPEQNKRPRQRSVMKKTEGNRMAQIRRIMG